MTLRGFEELPRWLGFTHGIAIAVFILAIVTALNRKRIAEMERANQAIDYVVRPFGALGKAAIMTLAAWGALLIFAYIFEDYERIRYSFMTSIPILAIGFAIDPTAYHYAENEQTF